MALIELQVDALDEELRRPEPLRRPGRQPETVEQPLGDVGCEVGAQLRAQPRAREKDAQRIAFKAADAVKTVDRRSGVQGSAG